MTTFDCEYKRPTIDLPDENFFKSVGQGAEAIVYEGMFFGKQCILKQRLPKTYRHPDLDLRLLRQRTVQEIRCLGRLLNIISVPRIFSVFPLNYSFIMEKINGQKVKDYLIELSEKFSPLIIGKIAKTIALMHNSNIVHCDLTTSNMIISSQNDNQIYLIDFGLSQVSKDSEEKAVDLYVLERSLGSVHSDIPQVFDLLLKEYFNTVNGREQIHTKLKEVQQRGRKRSMLG